MHACQVAHDSRSRCPTRPVAQQHLSLPFPLRPPRLYGGAPAASDLMNPTWWTRLVDPSHRASLAGNVAAAAAAGNRVALDDATQADVAVAAAAAAAATAAVEDALRPQVAVAGNVLAHQVAGECLPSALAPHTPQAKGLVWEDDRRLGDEGHLPQDRYIPPCRS